MIHTAEFPRAQSSLCHIEVFLRFGVLATNDRGELQPHAPLGAPPVARPRFPIRIEYCRSRTRLLWRE